MIGSMSLSSPAMLAIHFLHRTECVKPLAQAETWLCYAVVIIVLERHRQQSLAALGKSAEVEKKRPRVVQAAESGASDHSHKANNWYV